MHTLKTMFRLGRLGLLACAGLMAAHAPLARAAAVSVTADLLNPVVEDQAQASGDGTEQSAHARAQAGYGYGKLFTQALADWNIQPGQNAGGISSTATARASYADTLTIDSSVAPEGALGVLWFDVLVTFNMGFEQDVRGGGASNTGATSFYAYWDSFGSGLQTVGGYCHIAQGNVAEPGLNCGGWDVSEVAPGSYEARARYGVHFIFGQAFALGMRTEATTQAAVGLQNAESGGTADMLFDAGNSIYWDGIADVTWEDNAVPWTIRSASGTDYRNSFAPTPNQQVPTPPTLALMAGALLLLARQRTRRRR